MRGAQSEHHRPRLCPWASEAERSIALPPPSNGECASRGQQTEYATIRDYGIQRIHLYPDQRNHGHEALPKNFAWRMRASGVYGLLVCCSDYRCSHSITVNADQWPDERRLSDLEKHHLFGVRQEGRGGPAGFRLGEGAGSTDEISGMSWSLTNSDFDPGKNVRWLQADLPG